MDRATALERLVSELAEWVNSHDWHLPFAGGPPAKGQSYFKSEQVGEGDTAAEQFYCGKLFPRSTVLPGKERVEEDPHRPSLFRLWLARNCRFLNNHTPIVLLMLLANMDVQAITTKWGAVDYVTKYVTKHSAAKGPMLACAENAFNAALEAAHGKGQGILAAVGKFFNSQVAPGMMGALEVSHVLWRFKMCMSSRTMRTLSLKSDLRAIKSAGEVRSIAERQFELRLEGDTECRPAPLTRRSITDVYETRFGTPKFVHGMPTCVQSPGGEHPWRGT
eukprot:gene4751-1978_t